MNLLVLQWLPLCLVVIVSIALFLMLRSEKAARVRIEKTLSKTDKALKKADRQQESLSKQLNELRAGTLALGERLVDMEQHLNHVEDKQSELVMTDPDSRLYSRASKMVELGADIEELMNECEIPKAEAELLMSLRQKIARR